MLGGGCYITLDQIAPFKRQLSLREPAMGDGVNKCCRFLYCETFSRSFIYNNESSVKNTRILCEFLLSRLIVLLLVLFIKQDIKMYT